MAKPDRQAQKPVRDPLRAVNETCPRQSLWILTRWLGSVWLVPLGLKSVFERVDGCAQIGNVLLDRLVDLPDIVAPAAPGDQGADPNRSRLELWTCGRGQSRFFMAECQISPSTDSSLAPAFHRRGKQDRRSGRDFAESP